MRCALKSLCHFNSKEEGEEEDRRETDIRSTCRYRSRSFLLGFSVAPRFALALIVVHLEGHVVELCKQDKKKNVEERLEQAKMSEGSPACDDDLRDTISLPSIRRQVLQRTATNTECQTIAYSTYVRFLARPKKGKERADCACCRLPRFRLIVYSRAKEDLLPFNQQRNPPSNPLASSPNRNTSCRARRPASGARSTSCSRASSASMTSSRRMRPFGRLRGTRWSPRVSCLFTSREMKWNGKEKERKLIDLLPRPCVRRVVLSQIQETQLMKQSLWDLEAAHVKIRQESVLSIHRSLASLSSSASALSRFPAVSLSFPLSDTNTSSPISAGFLTVETPSLLPAHHPPSTPPPTATPSRQHRNHPNRPRPYLPIPLNLLNKLAPPVSPQARPSSSSSTSRPPTRTRPEVRPSYPRLDPHREELEELRTAEPIGEGTERRGFWVHRQERGG
jgi:hypothetical protein